MKPTFADLLRDCGLADCRVTEGPAPDDPAVTRYTVHVPHARVDAAVEAVYAHPAAADFDVTFDPLPPPLVPAEVGQVVRVFSKYRDSGDYPLGVVTSAQEVDGRTAYGCAYVLASLGARHVSDVYPFHLTPEDYDGYHSGFVAVVPPADVPAALAALVEAGHAAAVERAAEMRVAALRVLPAVAAALAAGGPVETVRRWAVREDDLPHGLTAALPRVRPPSP